MARPWVLLLALCVGLQIGPPAHAGTSRPSHRVSVAPQVIPQGGVAVVAVPAKDQRPPQARWMGRDVPLVQNERVKQWVGFLWADMRTGPGVYSLGVKRSAKGREEKIQVKIVKKEFGVRRLSLPKEMVDLDPETLERVQKESGIMNALWDAPATLPLWRGPFTRPMEGDVVGAFGVESIINDQPRSPHSGVDLRASRGTPVRAIHMGRVVLTADHYFTGLSVVLDHGGGIQSMYFHLDKIMVQQGQQVTRGAGIGLVGATGRATGPHLHFGVRVSGARVDPLQFLELGERMEKP